MTFLPHEIAATLKKAFGAGQATPDAIRTAANAHPEVTLPQLQRAYAAVAADPAIALHRPLPYKRLR